MKLKLDSISEIGKLPGYHIPAYDIPALRKRTFESPKWVHFGAGNLFRAFQAGAVQQMIESGAADTGIIVCEGYDTELISKCYHATDNLTIQMILDSDGTIEKNVIGSITEALDLTEDRNRIKQIFCSPSLQIISFTITEKGYRLIDSEGSMPSFIKDDMNHGPSRTKSLLGTVTALLAYRSEACGVPVAVVSMDNCSCNGEILRTAVSAFAKKWKDECRISQKTFDFILNRVSYPWTMIDRITPRPAEDIAELLEKDGIEDMQPFTTGQGTYTANFVNTERPKYLVIENDFPNGKPVLEKTGVIFTTRDQVDRSEKMKVCTCLNPPQTAMAILGCLLGYTSIAKEFQDPDIQAFLRRLCYREGMPVVEDPEVISPEMFEKEVFEVRLPNPYIRDTPQRIASDTSQKLPIRFGINMRKYLEKDPQKLEELVCMPMVFAFWLRYLLEVDDEGRAFTCSSDPYLPELQRQLSGMHLGRITAENECAVRRILGNSLYFGLDLKQTDLIDKIVGYWKRTMRGPGAVREILHEFMT